MVNGTFPWLIFWHPSALQTPDSRIIWMIPDRVLFPVISDAFKSTREILQGGNRVLQILGMKIQEFNRISSLKGVKVGRSKPNICSGSTLRPRRPEIFVTASLSCISRNFGHTEACQILLLDMITGKKAAGWELIRSAVTSRTWTTFGETPLPNELLP